MCEREGGGGLASELLCVVISACRLKRDGTAGGPSMVVATSDMSDVPTVLAVFLR